ncbi:Na+/H+ antiporter NhaA [Geobacter sp. AOG1]|uniref:Na+/H+ antiporter NhaA n=1 Tax=Geobacter sp. AOG1 TaxID=1566346 RepID=UPI001CC44A45|nr:Na+/H+ antiporter NhaA [Geobacter sp. AOG1]GFE59068.1 Na(+)/H(+) antiporter NhaA [Geobacter sp. AOG1]
MKKRANLLREFSIPLITGVIIALVWANLNQEGYHHFIHARLMGPLSVHFLTNDIFMVFFFGIAAAEITQNCMPGGDLYPIGRSVNPLLATFGGVAGPVAIYLFLNALAGSPALVNGWGIPTATDIAISWLVARLVFGNNHPAISFLLLLAIVDDAIGLAIIAIFYPDPSQPVAPGWLLLTCAGMLAAWILRCRKAKSYWSYILLGGGLSWAGLHFSNLHPALALVPIVPFLPHPLREEKELFEEDPQDVSTLSTFEHEWKIIVDFGLFTFGLVNAGVSLSSLGPVTWFVLGALLVGKCAGISACALLGGKIGFPLPEGMERRDLFLVGLIAGIGFTVSLFIADQAFVDQVLQEEAKMGALLSIGLSVIAIVAGKLLAIKKRH